MNLGTKHAIEGDSLRPRLVVINPRYWVSHFRGVSAGRAASNRLPTRPVCSRGPGAPGSEAEPGVRSALRLEEAQL